MGLLRFILALSVVLEHSNSIYGFRLVGGQIAVQTFYIISGFYMALILKEKYIGVNKSYKLFLGNRLLRLYPIYWIVLILTLLYSIIVAIITKGNSYGEFEPYINYIHCMNFGSLFFLIFTNIFLFLQDIVMFLGLDTLTGNLFFTSNFQNTDPKLYGFLFIPQAWTIGVEISFYLLAPYLVRKKINTIFLFILMSIFLRIVLAYYFKLQNDPWTYRFFPTELVFFLLGIVSYHLFKSLRKINIAEKSLFLVYISVIGFTAFFQFLPIPFKMYFYFFIFFISLPFIFILTKKWKYDRYIGELSYPIYISHILIITMIKSMNIQFLVTHGLIVVFIIVLFSILLNELVAKRIETIRQKRVL